MFGGNDQPPPPPSAPIQSVTSPTAEQTATMPGSGPKEKVAGQMEANLAKPGALATPAGDTETNKSLLGT